MTLHTPQDDAGLEHIAGTPAGGEDLSDDLEMLAGTNTDATAYIDPEDVDRLEGITTTDQYEGETTSTQEREEPAEQFDTLIETDLREGETDDSMEAVQEGLTYVPPIDPPINPYTDDPENAEVGAGFGLTAEDDLDADDLDTIGIGEDDLTARVRRTLRDDSRTQHLNRRIRIAEENGVVVVRGNVDDLTDSDMLVEVIGDVPGVAEVVDETVVGG